MLIEKRRHVLSFIVPARFAPGSLKRIVCKHFRTDAQRIRLWNRVAGVIRAILQKSFDRLIDNFGINQRTIGGDADYVLRGPGPSGLIVARKMCPFPSSKKTDLPATHIRDEG